MFFLYYEKVLFHFTVKKEKLQLKLVFHQYEKNRYLNNIDLKETWFMTI